VAPSQVYLALDSWDSAAAADADGGLNVLDAPRRRARHVVNVREVVDDSRNYRIVLEN